MSSDMAESSGLSASMRAYIFRFKVFKFKASKACSPLKFRVKYS